MVYARRKNGDADKPRDTRPLKALALAARLRITGEEGAWSVPSSSGNGQYRVLLNPNGPTGPGPDFERTGKAGKHLLAALFGMERDHGGQAFRIDTDPLPEKKTSAQNGPKYNEAQTTEKRRFQDLRADLGPGIEEPPPPQRGRRRTLLKDLGFACARQVCTPFRRRRCACARKEAQANGSRTQRMHRVPVGACFGSDLLPPVRRRWIVPRRWPLRVVATGFAPDASGCSTSRFGKWFAPKYGCTRQAQAGGKVHGRTGAKTNGGTAVAIRAPDANDCPQFIPLRRTTAQNFTGTEVPADKAYRSADNRAAVAALGGTACIPFKSTAPGAKGGRWEKRFPSYHFDREDFLKHCHQRANVASTFSMGKAPFRDPVRRGTATAMVNEVLCKFLGHNLGVVHQSHVALGSEPVCGSEPPSGPNDARKLAPSGAVEQNPVEMNPSGLPENRLSKWRSLAKPQKAVCAMQAMKPPPHPGPRGEGRKTSIKSTLRSAQRTAGSRLSPALAA